MSGIFRIPRSRGALSGLLLTLLGLWGVFAPLIGPFFHYGFRPDSPWTVTAGRILLQILPAALLVLCGLIILLSANRVLASAAAALAVLAGLWLVVGITISRLWASHGAQLGSPVGPLGRQVAEHTGLLTGLGALSTLLAALALGRFAVIGRRESRKAEKHAARRAAPAHEAGREPEREPREPVIRETGRGSGYTAVPGQGREEETAGKPQAGPPGQRGASEAEHEHEEKRGWIPGRRRHHTHT